MSGCESCHACRNASRTSGLYKIARGLLGIDVSDENRHLHLIAGCCFAIVLTPPSETVVPSVATQALLQAVRRRRRGPLSLPARYPCSPPGPCLWRRSYNFARSAASLPSSARPS